MPRSSPHWVAGAASAQAPSSRAQSQSDHWVWGGAESAALRRQIGPLAGVVQGGDPRSRPAQPQGGAADENARTETAGGFLGGPFSWPEGPSVGAAAAAAAAGGARRAT